MLKDIKQLTELYLQSECELLSSDQTWENFHDELILNASLKSIRILTDAPPKKCKYALFVNVDTDSRICEIEDYIEFDAVENWADHLFWRGSGGSRSDSLRNSPHKIYFKKEKNLKMPFVNPLETLLQKYCTLKGEIKNNNKDKTAGPLFWDEERIEETIWLQNVVDILKSNEEKINKNMGDKFPNLQNEEEIFVGLTIDKKPIGEYEIFRRYLLFVRFRSGIRGSTALFANKRLAETIKENVVTGICPSCKREKQLLDLWAVPAELSFYQTTDKCHLSFEHESDASFQLCQACSDSLYIFKQNLLQLLTKKLGGNECLILPSIKLIPQDNLEKSRLYSNIKRLFESSKDTSNSEKRLFYRLGKLGSYATVTFAFGDAIISGDSKNVRRLDKVNVIFPDVLPSRLSHIDDAINKSNTQLFEMWSLIGRNRSCFWKITDDFSILKNIFYPYWEEKKKQKSKSRGEVETYLRAIFYGFDLTNEKIASDCVSNLVFSIRKTLHSKETDNNSKYSFSNYINSLLPLYVLLSELKIISNESESEVKEMNEAATFEFQSMPNLSRFIEIHPLLKDKQYLSPFFVGCLFSYSEYLQKNNHNIAAYNWLGTMSLSYNDILEDVYPKILKYITNKEKIVGSPRIQEIMKAIAYFDTKKCNSDRAALVAFCHGWALGRDFIFLKKEDEEMNSNNIEGGQ